ncbi:hypothetical protein GGS24DRAFT_483179 [Hypoxylon argillaceum]|nr:hypothetical protein GGS24DRAFT_483179 [Hypoxylon argillaceum]
MFTIFVNRALAFGMVIALFFCIKDLPAAEKASENLFYPFLYVFQPAVGLFPVLSLYSQLLPEGDYMPQHLA